MEISVILWHYRVSCRHNLDVSMSESLSANQPVMRYVPSARLESSCMLADKIAEP